MTQEKREAAELLLANRLYLYSLLHKCFGCEPNAGLLGLLSSESTARAFGLLSAGKGDSLDRCSLFLAAVRERKDERAWLDEVRGEYTRLFIGPGRLAAPPWESVWLGEDGMLFQTVTLEVRECYRSFGLLPESYPHVADDSLALELAFLAKLADRALESWQNGDLEGLDRLLEGSEAFLSRHLLRWVPGFVERLWQTPTQQLYPQLCALLSAYLPRDLETLQELREALRS